MHLHLDPSRVPAVLKGTIDSSSVPVKGFSLAGSQHVLHHGNTITWPWSNGTSLNISVCVFGGDGGCN